MFSFWGLISCGGVMLLHPNWGKFKSFVTSWKGPEPAAQAHAELSGLPTSHRPGPGWVLPTAESPMESGLGIHGQLGLSPSGPWAKTACYPVHLHERWLWPLGSLGPGQHTGVVKCCRPQEGLQEAGPLGPAGFLGNEQGPGLCHPHRRSRPTLGGGQDVPPRGTQPA